MWVKFLTKSKDHAEGAIVEIADASAKTLIDNGICEATEAPEEIVKQTTELKGSLEAFVKTAVNEAVTATIKELIPAGGKGKSAPGGIGRIHDNEDDDPKFGFKSLSEQALAVKRFYTDGTSDDRLKRISKAATTLTNEGTGPDGGFATAPDFTTELMKYTFTDESLFNRCRSFTTNSNSLSIPKDETTPWGTSGVRAFWTAEAATALPTKADLGQDNIVLHKLTALAPVTDEMLQDSFIGLGAYLSQQAGDRIRFKVDDTIVTGSGVGQPLGFANSGALYTQAAESGQAAGTINITNIAKMLSRIPADSIKNLVWLIHPSAFPQVVILTNGNNSLYVGPGTVAAANPNMGTLFGIPVIISQHAQGIGTAGDIQLVDFSKYLILTKGSGIETAMSIHLYFDQSVTAFRFNFRVGGMPWMKAPIVSKNGSYSMSPFISLAAR